MTQTDLFDDSPIVTIGGDIRYTVGDGPGELQEAVARRIDFKLRYKNPELNKLKKRLASSLRGLGIKDEKFLCGAVDAAYKIARLPESDYGWFMRYLDDLAGPDGNAAKIKRAANIMYAIQKADEHVFACKRNGRNFSIPRGCLPWLLREFKGVVYDEQRVLGRQVDFKWRGPELRPYQVEAMKFQHHRDGLTVLPCGAGKTMTALAAIAQVGRSTVILVPTKEIRDEWISECWKCLGIAPGQVGDGKFEPNPKITIAINASAVKLNDEKFDAVFGAAGVLVVDEAHHVTVDSKLGDLVQRVPARVRWGYTATPFREDGRDIEIVWIMGPVVWKSTTRELVDGGYLVLPEVRKVRSEWECPDDINPSEDWNGMVDALITDDDRNAFVLENVANALQNHTRVLVLTCRTWHAQFLRNAMNNGDEWIATAVTSDETRKRRKESMEHFRSGSVRVVCAVNIADEGLNVPALDAVVVAGPIKAKSKTIQRLGRLMRPVDGKAPELIDIVDENVPHLKRQWYARRRAYKEVLGG